MTRAERHTIGSDGSSSRSQRRNGLKHPDKRRAIDIVKRLEEVGPRREASWAKGREAAEITGTSFTALAYRGQPFVQEVLSTSQQVHRLLEAAELEVSKGSIYIKIEEKIPEAIDSYGRQVFGTSLKDIEGMGPDPETGYLHKDDIKRINSMLRGREAIPLLSRLSSLRHSSKNHEVIDPLIILAIQSWARPETRKIEPSLKPLQNNLEAYFDYYVDMAIDPSLDSDTELQFSNTLGWLGPTFNAALAGYLPARLGISPSSAIKIYAQKTQQKFREGKSGWNIAKAHADTHLVEAYLEGSLPEDLAPYQFYNEEADARAAHILETHYRNALSSNEDQFEAHEKAKKEKAQFGASAASVFKQIFRDPDQRIELSMDHGAISRVTVTATNRRVAMFVIHLGEDTHVTLEMDKEGRVFGIPPSLLKKHPNIGDMLLADILPPLLEKVTPPKKNNLPPKAVVYPAPTLPQEIPEVDHEPEEPKVKVKTRGKRSSDGKPNLPTPERLPKKVRFVSHSEEQVRELLGGKKVNSQTIEQIMKTIERFEYGDKSAVRLRQNRNQVRIRVGNLRIVLNIEEGNNFSLDKIGDKEQFDNTRGFAA